MVKHMIDLKGKNKYVMPVIEAAGYKVSGLDGVLLSDNDVAVQAIIEAYDSLPEMKTDKITELKAEGLLRTQSVFPAVSDFDELDLIKEQYLSIAAAARQPTADFQKMIDLVQAGKAAAAAINTLTTEAEVNAYDVVNAPAWPV